METETMDIAKTKAVLESLLFTMGKAVPLKNLADVEGMMRKQCAGFFIR